MNLRTEINPSTTSASRGSHRLRAVGASRTIVLVDEHHLLEELAAQRLEPEHINPLLRYLQDALALNSNITGSRFHD